MREAVPVRLPKTGIERADDSNEYLHITATLTNECTLGIKAFKGRLTVTDQFDKVISSLGIRNGDSIQSGQVLQWEGSRVLQNNEHHDDRRLGSLKPGQYRVLWEPSEMLFADLARIRVPSE